MNTFHFQVFNGDGKMTIMKNKIKPATKTLSLIYNTPLF